MKVAVDVRTTLQPIPTPRFSRVVYFIRVGDPMDPPPLFYWILTTQCLRDDPRFWFIAGLRPWFLNLVCPKGTTPHPPHPPFSQDPLRNVYAKLISWIGQRIVSSCSKDLHESNVSTHFQWEMQDSDVWSTALILNSYVEKWISSM